MFLHSFRLVLTMKFKAVLLFPLLMPWAKVDTTLMSRAKVDTKLSYKPHQNLLVISLAIAQALVAFGVCGAALVC